jgi:hypothetical protein
MHPEIAQCLRMLARLNYIMGDHVEAMACQQKVSNTLPVHVQNRETGREEIEAVLGIRMFLGLPDPEPLVRGTDPDPDPDPSLFS